MKIINRFKISLIFHNIFQKPCIILLEFISIIQWKIIIDVVNIFNANMRNCVLILQQIVKVSMKKLNTLIHSQYFQIYSG